MKKLLALAGALVALAAAAPAFADDVHYRELDGINSTPVDANHPLPTTGGISGGAFGNTSDTVCATDTGNCSHIALIKRGNSDASLLLSSQPPPPSISYDINVTTAADTEIVPLSGSTKVYVWSWDAVAASADTVSIVAGTGTACATGKHTLAGPYSLAANGGIQKSGAAPVLISGAGEAVCLEHTQTTQVGGSMAVNQH